MHGRTYSICREYRVSWRSNRHYPHSNPIANAIVCALVHWSKTNRLNIVAFLSSHLVRFIQINTAHTSHVLPSITQVYLSSQLQRLWSDEIFVDLQFQQNDEHQLFTNMGKYHQQYSTSSSKGTSFIDWESISYILYQKALASVLITRKADMFKFYFDHGIHKMIWLCALRSIGDEKWSWLFHKHCFNEQRERLFFLYMQSNENFTNSSKEV